MNCCFHLHVVFTRRLSKQQFSFGNRRALYGKEFSLCLSSLKRVNTDLRNLCRSVSRCSPAATKTKNNWTGKRRYFERCRENGTVGSERRCAASIHQFLALLQQERSFGRSVITNFHPFVTAIFQSFPRECSPSLLLPVFAELCQDVSSLCVDLHCEAS